MNVRRTLAALILTGLLVGAAACASTKGTATRGDPNVLTPEEIAGTPVSNLYEAVERLRPRWLLIRSARSLNMPTQVVVFLNASYLGSPDALRQLGFDGLVRLRYMDSARASALYSVPSGVAIEGAIIVEVGRDD
ncbi:MAG TPA: hypothetical protein VGA70_02205 [Longimicrobiales bacterium]